jgi:hypothetical protein
VEKVSQERHEYEIPLPESNGTRFIAIPEERYKRLQSMEEENSTLWGALEAECELTSKVIAERDRYKAALETIREVKYDNLGYSPEDAHCMNAIATKALKGVDSQ